MQTLLADLRHGLRILRQTPALTAIAVASLALGVGANTAVFSVVHAVLLRPLPFPHPERIVTLEEREKNGEPAGTTGWATFVDWRTRAKSFEAVAAVGYTSYKLGASGTREAEKIEGLKVSGDFFRVLGVKPMLGRDLEASDDVKGAPRVAILSYGLWKRRFGGDPSVVGRTERISDVPITIVGVLPPEFEAVFAPEPQKPTEIWGTLRYDASLPYACRDCRHLRAFARLKPAVSLAAARAEMESIGRTLYTEHPNVYPAAGAFALPFSSRLTAPARPLLWTLLGAVAFVLLIACANVASLLMGQAAGRRR
jgi:putative ABC transport system permease protein